MNIDFNAIINNFENKLSSQSEDTKKELYKKLDIDFKDKCHFLDINVQSFASQIIDLDTSQFLYNKLRAYDSTTLAERIFITQIMSELIQKRRAQK